MSCINFDGMYSLQYDEQLKKYTRDARGLLTMELETSHICNYRCKYCYSNAGSPIKNELTLKELCDVVIQGKNLGVQTIVLIGGGEPLLYTYIRELIKFIFCQEINIILFTNGSKLNQEMAEFLRIHNVFPVLKVNGILKETMEWLCGNRHAYRHSIQAMNALSEAGYTSEKYKMGISTIICKQNADEIFSLWKWARENYLVPYFERVLPQGEANNIDLALNNNELSILFEELRRYDEEKWGIKWNSTHPPIAGAKCDRHLYSIYVKSDGTIQPCSGIEIPIGNIRNQELKQILEQSEIINQLRNIDVNIKGPCAKCEIESGCYGCRGSAYLLSGDYLESDPMCWHNGLLTSK